VSPNLSDLENLARQAGEIVRASYQRRPGYGPKLQVDLKGEIDPVTEVDHRTEAFILGEIRRRFPGHTLVTEESGHLEGNNQQVWFIDPLDGTLNYTHGVPLFTVSIAFAEDGLVRLGVIYDPIEEECFSAERGQGAWLNGEPVKVSETKELRRSLLGTGFPYDIRTNPNNNLANFTRVSRLVQGVRNMGSATQDLCYVAAGRLDGYWEIRLSAWDIAAGGLIAQEAGAIVTNLHGDPDYLTAPQSILAANPYLHPVLLELINRGSETENVNRET
jgi:myo-inositol-1(or 4)-monophosphatase